jgi:hypothetical protein
MSIEKCKILELQNFSDPRGNLCCIEAGSHIPFDIQRVYYLYEVPRGEERGSHAHKELQQLIIAVSGSFDVLLSDGKQKKRFTLNRPDQGLYLPKMLWRKLDSFLSGSVCLVLASNKYNESDYYRDYQEYLNAVKS